MVSRVAYITLNRPEKRNALNDEMVVLLHQAFEQAGIDKEVKVIVLKAAGNVFSAGADLDYIQRLQKNSYNDNLQDSSKLKDLFQLIYGNNKVVIAQVQGHAIAGGCGLAAVCDFVFTQPYAKFGYTEVHIGFVPAIVMVFLLRRIGAGAARDLLLSGRLVKAEEALVMGLVNKVLPEQRLEEEVNLFAQKIIVENSTQSMQRTKSMLAKIQEMEFEEALKFAADQNAQARDTEDCRKGIKAFLDKVPIKW